MLNFLNYKKTKDEIKRTLLENEKDILGFKEFKESIKDYIKNYNSLIDNYNKKNNNKYKKINENYENYSLDYFIIEENSDKNLLYQIYKDFINNQNKFIEDLIKNNSIKKLIVFLHDTEIIQVQDASESNIPQLIDENKLLEVIIKNCFLKYSFDSNNNNIYDENDKKLYFNYDKIEKSLIYEIFHDIKRFYSAEYGIIKIKFKGDEYKVINDEIIKDYEKKYNNKAIDENGEKKIIDFLKSKNKEDNYELLLSLQYLMIHILSLSKENSSNATKDNDIVDIIKRIPKDQANSRIKIELLKQLFNIKEEGEGNNVKEKINEEVNFLDLFNATVNIQQDNNYKLNQLISIFDICKKYI